MNDKALREAEQFILRVLQQGQSVVRPKEPLTFPEEKSEFPKLLCLDMNHWVQLGRAHYGRKGGDPYVDALRAIRTATESGRLLVPVTDINIGEATAREDEASRRRLAEFMVELSGNYALRSTVKIRDVQLHNAIRGVYLEREDTESIRSELMQWGVGHAFMQYPDYDTGDPNLDDRMNAVVRSPQVSVALMVDGMDRDVMRRLEEQEREDMQAIAEIRERHSSMSMEDRRLLELRGLAPSDIGDLLRVELAASGLDADEFFSWLEGTEQLQAFWNDVPWINVSLTLMLHRDRNPEDKTHPNDARDWSFLNLAIPYANVVATEKQWAHLARQTGLANRYSTVVLGDLPRLPEVLAEEGCLP